ncbi:hypothetical protein QR680_003719 [Steinernema hermaphroditum]|uniref:Uncharacterized protein n=1 Tax=Steinernema hermaphroditum TaxID=289476 RepID=A0AA39HLC0_9BILA|nr:hypothetical protein QR680_003719 [Steinernema hermaphroditum]
MYKMKKLLPNRRKETYIRLLEALTRLEPTPNSNTVMVRTIPINVLLSLYSSENEMSTKSSEKEELEILSKQTGERDEPQKDAEEAQRRNEALLFTATHVAGPKFTHCQIGVQKWPCCNNL